MQTDRTEMKVLHLEDDPRDSELVQAILKAGCPDCKVTRVVRRQDFEAALDAAEFDVILSDYRLPSFDGLSALALVREKKPHLPFILLSGTIGEEAAVDALKSGATDYVPKTRLERLIPAIQRARREAEQRTDLERTQRQLLQAQKMEAVGRLAGGLAHDFNNLLTVILGHTEMALARDNLTDPLRRDLQDIRFAVDRAGDLTRRILTFSRRQELEPRVLDLNQVVPNMAKMIGRLIGEDVVLKVNLDPELGSVKIDPGQIEQAILNLAVNARDAMPNGGSLRIETGNVHLDEAYASQHPEVEAGDYVMMAVSDTGLGMDPDTMSRIFEPFFTTKDPSKGTGLGLSMVYGFVRQSGGHTFVYSEPGRGTTFKIYFPRIEGIGRHPARRNVAAAIPGGHELVLVVEDDPMVRGLIREVLRSKGYTVLEAGNGPDAIRAAKEVVVQIELLITDLVLPGLSGHEVARELMTTRPALKVLFMSGYTSIGAETQRLLPSGANYLQKPFSIQELARKVRDLLDGKA